MQFMRLDFRHQPISVPSYNARNILIALIKIQNYEDDIFWVLFWLSLFHISPKTRDRSEGNISSTQKIALSYFTTHFQSLSF